MAATLIDQDNNGFSSTESVGQSVSVEAGDLLIAKVGFNTLAGGVGVADFTVTDSQSNAWSGADSAASIVGSNPSNTENRLWFATAGSTGSVIVLAQWTGVATGMLIVEVFRIPGTDPIDIPAGLSGSFEHTSNSTAHQGVADPGFDAQEDDVMVIVATTDGSTGGAPTPASGWTGSVSGRTYSGYRLPVGAVSDDAAEWASGNARPSTNLYAIFRRTAEAEPEPEPHFVYPAITDARFNEGFN